MSIGLDLLSLVVLSTGILVLAEPSSLSVYLALALAGALANAAGCVYSATLWTRAFHFRWKYVPILAVAALAAFGLVAGLAGTRHAKEAALASIAAWETEIKHDPVWNTLTFAKAFQKVKELGLEDFTGLKPNSTFPITHLESRRAVASVYAEEACSYFNSQRPFLSKVVWARQGRPSNFVLHDVNRELLQRELYLGEEAGRLAAEQIRLDLTPQIPRVKWVIRLSLLAAFVVLQCLCYGLVGWAVSREIQPRLPR